MKPAPIATSTTPPTTPASLICKAHGCTFYAEVDGFCSAHRPGRPMPVSPNKNPKFAHKLPRPKTPEEEEKAPTPKARRFVPHDEAGHAPSSEPRDGDDHREVRFSEGEAPTFARRSSSAPLPPLDDDESAGPRMQLLLSTPAGQTLYADDVRPKHRIATLFAKVEAWVGLERECLRLVAAGKQLEAHRRVKDYGLRRNAKVSVALKMGGNTPCGPCLHQWLRAIQVNGADVRVGANDSRYPEVNAFEATTRAIVGPDGRARVVLTFHSAETAHNLCLPWGRVEPARGGTAVDVDIDALKASFGLARSLNRTHAVEDGVPTSELLAYRAGDARLATAGVSGPSKGELEHRARTGFSFRYDYFHDARQVTLQFVDVVPDTEYLLGLAAPGRLVHEGKAHKKLVGTDGFRDPASYRVYFERGRRDEEPPAEPPAADDGPVVLPPPRRRMCCAVS